MGRVEWSRLGGDLTEGVLGVLLLRRHPGARRVRPSRGDGGVDVYVPTADGWVVFQIKSFTESLTSSHKTQITKSWNSFRRLVEARKPKIKSWHVVRPLNATWEDEDFLSDLTKGAPWSCSWLGLDDCDELAAAYPDVIDYYLHDGKDRLERVLREQLTAAGFARRTDGDPVAPAAAAATLEAVHAAINAVDPHFRYDFTVHHRPAGTAPDDLSLPVPLHPAPPDLIASVTRYDRDRAITFHVFGRFEQATEERSIPLGFHALAEPGTPEHQAWQDLLDFGVTSPLPLPVKDLTMALPGELGISDATGLVRLGPPDDTAEHTWTLILLGSDERTEVARIDLTGGMPRTGLTGRGWSLQLRDPHGAIELLLRVETETAVTTYELRHLPVFGKTPSDLLGGLRVAAAFHAPHAITLGLAGGPPLADPMALNGPHNAAFDRVLHLIDNLATLQRHTYTKITVPELPHLTTQAGDWEIAARLLNGESLTATTPSCTLDIEDMTLAEGDLVQMVTREQLSVEVGDLAVNLDATVQTHTVMRVAAVADADGRRTAQLEPHGRATVTAGPGAPEVDEIPPTADPGS